MNNTMIRRKVGQQELDVIVLTAGDAVAEIWPALGGNCVRWATGGTGEVLCSPPMEELVGRPTRGGIPVLFPFPNRIRAGRFRFNRIDYELPCNDSTKQNAIHGFSPRLPWQVQSLETNAARLNFRISRDAPDCLPHWPGDAVLSLIWKLSPTALSCHAEVHNCSELAVPFGLGFHPYFRLTGPDDKIRVPARDRWELADSLPTGDVLPTHGDFDLTKMRRVGDLRLDDVFTNLDVSHHENNLSDVGRLVRADGVAIRVQTTRDFREMVVFTPPHGQAVCLEPYTCPTDAANLASNERNVGWRSLNANENWFGEVNYELGRG